MLDINGRVGSVWPQSGVTLSVSNPSGRSNGFGTLPHQAEIGFKHGVHWQRILGWRLGED